MPSIASASLRALSFLATLACAASATAQERVDGAFYQRARVANYSLAEHGYGSPKFEEFSFWADDRGGRRIDYAYGTRDAGITLQSLGRSADGHGFSARFPNGYVLDFRLDGDRLRVSDRQGRYRKSFAWMYEGPVDGRGTFCTPCVEQPEAASFVRTHFLQGAP